MASPATAIRNELKDLIATVYSDEGWTAADDKFGRSKGMGMAEDEAAIAVYTDSETQRPGRILELIVLVTVQFHLGYKAEPDETIVRDPGVIEAYADRLRAAFDEGGGADHWFSHLISITYPDDPTGNKTRFEARIEGRAGNTPALPT